MQKILKLLCLFFLALLLSFARFPIPSYSQSAVGCASDPVCVTELGLVRSAIVSPSPINPFVVVGTNLARNADKVVIVGGALALGYMTNQSMTNLQNKAISNSPSVYASYAVQRSDGYLFPGTGNNCSIQPDTRYGDPYVDGVIDGSIVALGFLASQISCVGVGSPVVPSPSQSAPNLSSSNLFSEASTSAAAAAAAALSAKDYTGALTAANAAIDAAASVTSDSSSSPADIAAASAAAASAGVTAAAAAAPAQQEKDKALADSLSPPSVLPTKSYAGSVNFVTFALSAFSAKFPFDIIYGATDAVIPSCPVFTLFFYKWTVCFIMPVFLCIRWVVFIGLATKVVLEL